VRCEGLPAGLCGANLASALAGSAVVVELENGHALVHLDDSPQRDRVGPGLGTGRARRRVLAIDFGNYAPFGRASLTGLHITNGRTGENAYWLGTKNDGGGVYMHSGVVTFDSCIMSGNSADVRWWYLRADGRRHVQRLHHHRQPCCRGISRRDAWWSRRHACHLRQLHHIRE